MKNDNQVIPKLASTVEDNKWKIAAVFGAAAAGLGSYYVYKKYYSKPRKPKDGESRPNQVPKRNELPAEKTSGTSVTTESEKPPVTSQELKNKGNNAFKQGKYADAIDYYTKAIELGVTDVSDKSTFFQNRAAAYEQLKNYTKVVEDCSVAIELNSKYVKAYLRRAKAHEHLKKLEEALEDVTTTCLLEGFQNQSTLTMADRVLKELGSQHAKEALATRVPVLPSSHYIKSFLASFSDDPVIKAAKEIKSSSDVELSSIQKALVHLRDGSYDDVLSLCEEALAADENDEHARLLRGTFKMLSCDITGAVKDFDWVVENAKDPKVKVNAIIKRASLRMTQNSSADSLEDFKSAVEIDKDNADIYHHRGQINLLLERMDESRSDFAKAVELNSNYPIAYVQKLYADYKYYAYISGDQRRAEGVMREFEEAITKYPDCTECYSLCAQVLTDTGRYEEAEALFKKAQSLDPLNSNMSVHIALLALQTKGDVEEAARLLERAIEMDPKCGFALETIATIEVQRGNLQKAVAYFKKAIPLARSEPELSHLYSLMDAAIAQSKIAAKLGLPVPQQF